MSGYSTTCDCGHEAFITGDDSDCSFIVWRVNCPECGRVMYPMHKTPGGRVHDGTARLHRAIHDVFADIKPPMTVRQVYYQLTVRKVVDKTQAGYEQTQRALTVMRRNGSLPYGHICDMSRDVYRVNAHRDVYDALDQMHHYYRRDLWAEQSAHVEIWLEKRALASQLIPICNEFGVPLYPMGGFTSISFAYTAAMELREIDKDIHIYHLSDLDASGAYSSVSLERELRTHAEKFHFHRLGLTPEQVNAWGLHDATREQKRSTHSDWWVGRYGATQRACELDAIHPDTLRRTVRDAITRHIDPYHWERMQRIETLEREGIERTIGALRKQNWQFAPKT